MKPNRATKAIALGTVMAVVVPLLGAWSWPNTRWGTAQPLYKALGGNCITDVQNSWKSSQAGTAQYLRHPDLGTLAGSLWNDFVLIRKAWNEPRCVADSPGNPDGEDGLAAGE